MYIMSRITLREVIQNTFSVKRTCSAGDSHSLRNVEVYLLARGVLLRVDL